MDYETGKILEGVEARLLALEAKFAPKPKKTEDEEETEAPIGKPKSRKAMTDKQRIVKKMQEMKYEDVKEKGTTRLKPEEEIITDGIEEEYEDESELLEE